MTKQISKHIKARFLKNLRNGRVVAWSSVLANRDDMIPCDQFGNLALPDKDDPYFIAQTKNDMNVVMDNYEELSERADFIDELKGFIRPEVNDEHAAQFLNHTRSPVEQLKAAQRAILISLTNNSPVYGDNVDLDAATQFIEQASEFIDTQLLEDKVAEIQDRKLLGHTTTAVPDEDKQEVQRYKLDFYKPRFYNASVAGHKINLASRHRPWWLTLFNRIRGFLLWTLDRKR